MRFLSSAYPDLHLEIDFSGSRAKVAFNTTKALSNRGLLNGHFYERLLTERPGLKSEIEAKVGGFGHRSSSELDTLYEKLAELERTKGDTTKVNEQILKLKRELRAGPELISGDRLRGRYKLIERLGDGGFATVWKAFDVERRRHVAVKVLHGQYTSSPQRIDRFFRGARIMERLEHDHIVKVLDPKGEDDGHRFFVMELLDGGDLSQHISAGGLSADTLLDYIEAIAVALAHAHARDIIHRDVKPANILLTGNGVPKLADFDLVRAADTTGGTRTGALGTFIYAAPEAMEDASTVGPSVDVYGLAMTAVAGLLGRRPTQIEKFQPNRLVRLLKVPAPVVDVLRKSLQITPNRRPKNAGAFLASLEKARPHRRASETRAADSPIQPRSDMGSVVTRLDPTTDYGLNAVLRTLATGLGGLATLIFFPLKFSLGLVLGWFTDDVMIDLGTANTVVAVAGRGIVLDEPSVVAVTQGAGKRVVAVGHEAKEMLGKTPGTIAAVLPMREGVIADFVVTEIMIKYFIRKALKRNRFIRARLIISIPAGITDIETKAVREAAISAGVRDVLLIEHPMAAAVGAGLPVLDARGTMIVDIGGGTTDVAVISLGGLVTYRTLKIAGDRINEAIIQYVRRRSNILIGERTAEQVQMKLGNVHPSCKRDSMELKGRDLRSGVARSIRITGEEVLEALDDVRQLIVEAIRSVLERAPPALTVDLQERGIILTGGGALLCGIDRCLREETGLPVNVSEEPLLAGIRGMAMVQADLDAYRGLLF